MRAATVSTHEENKGGLVQYSHKIDASNKASVRGGCSERESLSVIR